MHYFARPELAQNLTDSLRGRTLFGDEHNGLFLAAPRRTGKSTFLQNDLKPALDAAGCVVVYTDLWADRARDPGELIAESIGQALTEHLGLVARTAKAAGLDQVSLAGWLKIDTAKIGRLDGTTLADALKALHGAAKKPVALIIDEAQHSLTSNAGETAMTALKSARDQMNKPGEVNLMLVMSGSDRDKLLRLVNTTGAPFYGSTISKMPLLDRAFVESVATRIESVRKDPEPVDIDKLWTAFQLFGHRPQFFAQVLGFALNPLNDIQVRFEDYTLTEATRQQAADEAQMESSYIALKPLEQAIIWRLLDRGELFRPYDADTLQFYEAKVGKKVTPAQTQNALETLRSLNPALVWKSARGEYALDDAMMHQWYAKRVQADAWPPADDWSPANTEPTEL